ncbi:SIR2 family protein [Anaerosinus massiliensis]|uniref:SIR2 family protein n=1 Tax=Massilibacillus massiliensis TaxID=1806837 RepID=UPI000A3F94DE|nr:SIR2 family protein [Massilibacillus massiliensis]
MEINDVKTVIQDFFQENTVTIIGSGLSVAEGIPGMGSLSVELLDKLPCKINEKADVDNWKAISDRLKVGEGLEEALHSEKPTSIVEEKIRETTAEFIRTAEKKALNSVLSGSKRFRLSDYLQRFNIRNNGLTVITTNYDRLVEYSCEMNGIRVDTLFVGKFICQFSPDESKYSFCKNIYKLRGQSRVEYSPKVKVLKPHGCLSWYQINGCAYSVPHLEKDNCLIITPGINKYREGYNEPFDTHRARANAAIDSALRYIIIGYGFGDDHLETHLLRQLNSNKPALILTHSLSDKAIKVVKGCKNVIAVCNRDNGSLVMNKDGEIFFPSINLWDIREMIKEVF